MTAPVDDDVRTADGRRLHLLRWAGPVTTGATSPTVVLDAGMGATRLQWSLVAPLVAERVDVVAYDRSGLGRSDPDPEPRTLARAAADLNEVLDHLEGDGAPAFVLVAHSYAGLVDRVAAARRPERIVGMVLVDVSDEGCAGFFSRGAVLQNRLSPALLLVMARTGMLKAGLRRAMASLPPDVAAQVVAEDSTVTAAKALTTELAPFISDMRDLVASPLPAPTHALSVISGTKASRAGRHRRDELVAAHRARAAEASNGWHKTADRSAHLVHLTEPELVASEVLRVIDAAST
jgi:pimeloyl-ACP methyl ester carboxylesterase